MWLIQLGWRVLILKQDRVWILQLHQSPCHPHCSNGLFVQQEYKTKEKYESDREGSATPSEDMTSSPCAQHNGSYKTHSEEELFLGGNATKTFLFVSGCKLDVLSLLSSVALSVSLSLQVCVISGESLTSSQFLRSGSTDANGITASFSSN
ncbi:hypothetical protein GOODEAATRI_005588 [Goodea atripinnis]|uniref:Uncharacterized protein n=1 Tax=Goodea atripinnis TaxID=208336 RepID=A0ABV0NS41_9TELE